MKFAILAVVAIVSQSAFASTVVIEDKRCVTAPAQRIHDSITNYKNYVNLTGARYAKKIPGYGEMPMLTMVKSQENKLFARTAEKTDGYAWVVLQPTNITKSAVYPQFLLKCSSGFDSKTHFTHYCKLQADKLHYGLDDFESHLDVTESDAECGEGKSHLIYKLVLVGNDKQVEEIKTEVLKPLGVIGDIVGTFFDEEKFFRDYYVNFYNGWAKSL